MRVLPRTARGTWLLAGAVWLAGAAAFWSVLAPLPRASWSLSGEQVAVGFVPGTRTFVTKSAGPRGPDGTPVSDPVGPMTFWDGDTGRHHSWFTAADRVAPIQLSADGRWVVVSQGPRDDERLNLYELATGRLAFTFPLHGRSREGASFSEDGRRFVHSDDQNGVPILRVWDLDTFRERATVPNAGAPFALSPDGRLLAHKEYVPAGEDQWTNRVRLWDVEQDCAARAFPWRDQVAFPHTLRFSPDGRFLMFHSLSGNWGPWNPRGEDHFQSEVSCWEVASGREQVRTESRLAFFPRGRPWFLALDEPSSQSGLTPIRLTSYDGGRELGRGQVALRFGLLGHTVVWDGLSPDGRFLAVGAPPEDTICGDATLRHGSRFSDHAPERPDRPAGGATVHGHRLPDFLRVGAGAVFARRLAVGRGRGRLP
jgi:WD40 repeat protein